MGKRQGNKEKKELQRDRNRGTRQEGTKERHKCKQRRKVINQRIR